MVPYKEKSSFCFLFLKKKNALDTKIKLSSAIKKNAISNLLYIDEACSGFTEATLDKLFSNS